MQQENIQSTVFKGRQIERRAAAFLKRLGYRLIATNFRTRWGEIDLIACENACLVFVEVKGRNTLRFGSPEEAITPKKRRRLMKTANGYLQQHPWPGAVRFDVVVLDRGHFRLHRSAWEEPC